MNAFSKFFGISAPNSDPAKPGASFNGIRWATFISATMAYAFYYVCRLSMNVVRAPMVEDKVFTTTELGIIGSCLFIVYAIGKFFSGFLADRSNVRRFMGIGLLCTSLINLALGFTNMFIVFAVLWGLNGWFQSMGAPAGVVSLNRWFDSKDRGTYYGFWSASHNIGEALSFITVSAVVGVLGWRYGLWTAGLVGLLGVVMVYFFMSDTPQSRGFMLDREMPAQAAASKNESEEFNKAQKQVLLSLPIWILALSSAFMYISRYAINSWGMFFLEMEKGYDTITAGQIISISSVCGIVGTVFSGLISDRLFRGSRNIPALVGGLMNTVALCMFLLIPGQNYWLDVAAMIIFGLGIGILICFVGGLMAVDIAPKAAAGAALGVVGMASYAAAALQDVVNGVLLNNTKHMVNGVEVYDFSMIRWFWIGSAALSMILALLIWNAKHNDEAPIKEEAVADI